MGHEDVEGLLDGPWIVVQDKMDGANMSVGNVAGHFIIASRNRVVSLDEFPTTGFNGSVEYVLAHAGIRRFAKDHPNVVLRGEWLVRHTLNYAPEAYKKLYVFDVQRLKYRENPQEPGAWEFLSYGMYSGLLEEYGIEYIKTIAPPATQTLENLVALSQGPDAWGSPQKEGIVIKRYDYVNKYGRTTWGKLVTADFKEKHKVEMGPSNTDPAEIKFASLVTKSVILKNIAKAAELKNETPRIQHMAAVLGMTWHDAVVEELWGFIRKARVRTLDFDTSRRLIERKTCDIALAYYNGTLEATNGDTQVLGTGSSPVRPESATGDAGRKGAAVTVQPGVESGQG